MDSLLWRVLKSQRENVSYYGAIPALFGALPVAPDSPFPSPEQKKTKISNTKLSYTVPDRTRT